MRFQINEVRVKTKTLCPEYFTWLQRLAIKWLKIPVEERYYHDFYLTCFKENYLKSNMIILLDGSDATCRILHTTSDKFTIIISNVVPITIDQGKLLCTSKEGFLIGSTFEENNKYK